MIIERILTNGKKLSIDCEGMLLTAYVDGQQVATGGLSKIPAALAAQTAGYAMLACQKVPVTAEEAKKLQSAIDDGRRAINKKIAEAKAYNNLMNEGGEGCTPYKF